MRLNDVYGYSCYYGKENLAFYGNLSQGTFNRRITYTLWCDNIEII